MLYNYLKILHILSATLLITSIVYSYSIWRQRSKDVIAITSRIQTLTLLAVIPLAIIQLTTGFTLISLHSYDVSQLWIEGSIIGFIIMISSWICFIYFLLLSQQGNPYRRIQFVSFTVCILTLLVMVFFMTRINP